MNTAIAAAASTRYAKRSLMDRIRAHPAGNVTIVFIVALILCVLASLAFDSFRFTAPANLSILMRAIPTTGIMALGVGLLMITGDYDLSVGATFGLGSYIMVLAWSLGVPLPLAVAAALAVAGLIGLMNGWITVYYGIPSFITTLGTLFILRSGGRIISGNRPISFFPEPWFKEALTGNILGIQMQFVWFVALCFLAWAILNRHWIGNHFFAVGGNRTAAIQVGINARSTRITAFVLCALFAVIAGLFSVTRIESGTTESQMFLELEAVAVCVMGGLALTGGRGSILGIFVGACMFHLVKDVILLARLPAFYLDFFVGLIIIFGVSMNQFAKKRY
jgi:simple sugar transport system permease protein